MTKYLKPGRYKKHDGTDVIICVDKRRFGYTGSCPLSAFHAGKPKHGTSLYVDEIANPEAGPLPERPKLYIVTHSISGKRLDAPRFISTAGGANNHLLDGYTVHERPWPDELMDLLEGE